MQAVQVLDAMLFLSTPSARRATIAIQRENQMSNISIHALREEGDGHVAALGTGAERFLSTPSARRATSCFCQLSTT